MQFVRDLTKMKKKIILVVGIIMSILVLIVIYAKQPSLSFDRNLGCDRCSNHKAPGLASVIMNISVATDTEVDNSDLIDYYPVDWTVTNANGGTTSSFNATYNIISWNTGIVTDMASKTYTIQSPTETHPTTKYYFYSEFNSTMSDSWMIQVADPSSGTSTANSTLTLKQSSAITLKSNGKLEF
jgi:hypothetical protein